MRVFDRNRPDDTRTGQTWRTSRVRQIRRGAVVRFHPATGDRAEGNIYPVGVVGPDGTFQVRTRAPGDGAAVGEYRLTVRWEKEIDPLSPDMLGGKFRDPNNAVRTVTVSEGENVLEPIRLEARISDRPAAIKDDEPAKKEK